MSSPTSHPLTGFIGGGNMALAIIGGLRRAGVPAERLRVVEPVPEQRERLRQATGVEAMAAAEDRLAPCEANVWAVKPQHVADAAAACQGMTTRALHLSIMAGVRCASLGTATGAQRLVRAMPNTPALIGRGISGLYAVDAVDADSRHWAASLLQTCGSVVWVDHEADLDAVTALSGSGPAYIFYFIEAMVQAGTEMGLSAAIARQLAQETFAGAAALAMQSPESPQTLRERVTSKGGTTAAALAHLNAHGVGQHFAQALHAARQRAEELGRS
ncbi:MAG: pyrroline-5-carboxylate reductase [Rubrivivax sp.]